MPYTRAACRWPQSCPDAGPQLHGEPLAALQGSTTTAAPELDQQLQYHCKLCVSAQRAMLAEEASCYQLDCSRGHSTNPGKQGRKSLLWLRTSRGGQKSGPCLPGPAVTHCSPPETSSAPTESSWKTQHFIFLKQINTLSNVPIYTEMQFWKY